MHPALAGLAAALALASMASARGAGIELKDRAQLEALLRGTTPCCVIDARAEASRRREPLEGMLSYREGLKIVPTSVVVVIGEDDAGALRTGRELAKASGAKDVVAVKGGAATWRALTTREPAAGQPMSTLFVIPKNTCEQGDPLQVLRSKPR